MGYTWIRVKGHINVFRGHWSLYRVFCFLCRDWRDQKKINYMYRVKGHKGHKKSKCHFSLIFLKMSLIQKETQDHHTWSVESFINIATCMVFRDKGHMSHKGHYRSFTSVKGQEQVIRGQNVLFSWLLLLILLQITTQNHQKVQHNHWPFMEFIKVTSAIIPRVLSRTPSMSSSSYCYLVYLYFKFCSVLACDILGLGML